MLKRLFFIILSTLFFLVTTHAAKRPNILFILADDQSQEDLKIYNPLSELSTPTLDKLAQEGMVFDGAYHMGSWSGAVCAPSRTMIMTGRSVWHIPGSGNPNNDNANMVPVDIADNTMAAIFNRAGYATMRTCKMYNSYTAANNQFTVNVESISRDGNDSTGSAWHTEQVLNYLDDREASEDDAPFLIYFGFSHPHDPRNGKEGLLEKYGAVNHTDENSLPELNDEQPTLAYSYLPEHPFFHGHYNLRDEERVEGVWKNRDEATIRNEMGREFACSENIDDQVSRVLDRLEEMGELENTYVFYTSDHGIAIGKHGLQGKQNLYDHTWKVPFIVKGPGVQTGRAEGNIYLYDVLGTMCDLAGITMPESVESVSFRSVLEGQDWKLIKYDVDNGDVRETQLFNVADNPDEILSQHHSPEVIALTGNTPSIDQVNLATDMRYADTLAMLETLLLDAMASNDDPYRLWNQVSENYEFPVVGDSVSLIDMSGAVAIASDIYNNQDQFTGRFAVDFDSLSLVSNLNTRWATNKPEGSVLPVDGWYLDIEFPDSVTFTHFVVYDFDNRVTGFAIETFEDDSFIEVYSGSAIGEDIGNKVYQKVVKMDSKLTTSRLRYHILDVVDTSKGPSTWGIEFYYVEDSSLGLEEVSSFKNYIFPTVVNNTVNISDEVTIKAIDVYTINGKVLFHSSNTDQRIVDFSLFLPGSYIVSVLDSDGRRYTQKVLKM